MAARKRRTTAATTAKQAEAARSSMDTSSKAAKLTTTPGNQPAVQAVEKEEHAQHLPPLFLVFVVLFCSGFFLMLALRDFLSTGRNVLGEWDEAMLLFTKSTAWYNDSKGWKSTQGGLSAIQQVTTDENNMGGFFVRKLQGAAAVALQMQKMVPLLMVDAAQWNRGHFTPLFSTAVLANLSWMIFHAFYWEDLVAAGASDLPRLQMAVLALETVVVLYALIGNLKSARSRGPAVVLTEGKTPSSLVSRIVTRTVVTVSSLTAMIAGRDLFFPGTIWEFFPRDDIYLEWTNALQHSPPPGSPEDAEYGLEAPLYIGDKFASQLMALNLLLLCLYKFVSAVLVRYGADGRGEVQAKLIWKVQAVGNAMVLFLLRLFTPAAASASLDLRWHLMAVAYETFIIGLYAYF